MIGNLKAPIWIIPALVMVMVIGAFAVASSLNQFGATPVEAVDDGFTVIVTELTEIGGGQWLPHSLRIRGRFYNGRYRK